MVLVNGIGNFYVYIDDSVINQSFKHILACQFGQKNHLLSFICSLLFHFLFSPHFMFSVHSE